MNGPFLLPSLADTVCYTRPSTPTPFFFSLFNSTVCRQPKLIRALYELYGTKYILIGVWKLIWAACTWAGAYYFLRVSIEFLEKALPTRTGHLYAMGLLLTSIGSSIAIHQLYGQCTALGIQVCYNKTIVSIVFDCFFSHDPSQHSLFVQGWADKRTGKNQEKFQAIKHPVANPMNLFLFALSI